LSIDKENMPDFLVRTRDRLRFSQGFAERSGSFEDWRAAGLGLLRRAIGPALDGETAIKEVGRIEIGGVTRLRLRARFPTGAGTEALMLLPPGAGPHPAVLLLHDHGSAFAIGKEKVITPWDDPACAAEAAAWQGRLYDGVSLGEALVARGFVVLASDALGWGSRRGNGYEAQQALAANLMQFGLTLAGVIAAEDAQMARWLARHPAVDALRVGVLGFSFGGYRAWQAAALCPEVAAGVAVSWMSRLSDLMQPGGNQLRGQSAFAMLHPALGGRLDYPDVAGLAAPKPMLFLSGAEDPHFPRAAAEVAFADLRQIWRASGAASALEAVVTGGAHVFTTTQQERAFAFLEYSLAPALLSETSEQTNRAAPPPISTLR
jgi:dienelactone hydrolase